MSLFKIASVAAIALTLGACASLFQPNYRTPLETTRDASETLKPGCSNPDCPLVNIDTLRWPALLAWLGGISTYHLLANLYPDVGATLPALVLAGLLQLVLGRAFSYGRETARV